MEVIEIVYSTLGLLWNDASSTLGYFWADSVAPIVSTDCFVWDCYGDNS